MRQRAVALVATPFLLLSLAAAAAVDQPREVARLRGLDKVTARTVTFDVPVDAQGSFGSLTVGVRACFAAAPNATPESAAFLEVVDAPAAGTPAEVFSGWMFASSPGVSALDHAVYDVWVIACLDRAEAARVAPVDAELEEAGLVPRRRPREGGRQPKLAWRSRARRSSRR